MPKKPKKPSGFLAVARDVVEAAIGGPLTPKKPRKKPLRRKAKK